MLNEQRVVVGNCCGKRQPSPALQDHRCAEAATKQIIPLFPLHQKGSCQGGVHEHDFKRQSVNTGNGDATRERNIVDLSDPQKIPWKSGDPRSGQFDSHPQDRRRNQSAQAAGAASHGKGKRSPNAP